MISRARWASTTRDAFAAKWLAFATVIEICSTPALTVRAISKRALGGQLRSIVG